MPKGAKRCYNAIDGNGKPTTAQFPPKGGRKFTRLCLPYEVGKRRCLMTTTHTTPNNEVVSTIINAQTCTELSLRVPYKALATVYAKSGLKFIYELQLGLWAGYKLFQSLTDGRGDATVGSIYQDGFDLFQECYAFLWQHQGHSIEDTIDTDRKGNPVSILKACFKYLNKHIHSEGQTVYKTVSFEGKFSARELVLIPEWDTEITYGDLPEIGEIIQSLGLNDRQRQVVSAKFATEGSTAMVADAVGIKPALVYKSLQQVSTKLILKRPKTLLSVLELPYRQKAILRLRLKMLGENATFDGIFDTDNKALRYMARHFANSPIPDMQSISPTEIVDTLSLIREKARKFFPTH